MSTLFRKKYMLVQYGGPDGELSASMRYLAQRYTMPYNTVTGVLTDIGTEELAHFEMICAIVYQLTKNLTPEEIKESGFDKYYVDHTLALWPQAAGGIPFNACEFQSKGDVITDLMEDMAADAAPLYWQYPGGCLYRDFRLERVTLCVKQVRMLY